MCLILVYSYSTVYVQYTHVLGINRLIFVFLISDCIDVFNEPGPIQYVHSTDANSLLLYSTCGVQHAASRVRRAACGVRRAAFGVRRPACGVRRVACGVWCAACGVRHLATLRVGAALP